MADHSLFERVNGLNFQSKNTKKVSNTLHIVPIREYFMRKIVTLFFLTTSLNIIYVLGAQKNRLTDTVLLSTYNICFG